VEKLRWWHVTVVGITVLLAVMVLWVDLPVVRQVGALAALGGFVIGWFVIGRLAWQHAWAANLFLAILVITTGAAVSFFPTMAILQCIAYPLAWIVSPGPRAAILANVAIAIAVGVGFLISTGTSPSALAQTGLTVALSLGFSIAIGMWITQISKLSDQRQALLTELRSAQDELAALNRDAGVTSERERLAREIHDTIAQDLTGLVMTAQRAQRDLETGRVAQASEQLAVLEENARAALAETRALVASTAAVGPTSGDIAEALERLAERFARETGVAVAVEVQTLSSLDRDTEVVLLRSAQECLANIRKHARATSTTLRLTHRDGTLTLAVTDDGVGFDPAARSKGFGLNGLRDRLALVGGALDVASSSAGTTLTATLPTGSAR
jgi:signal transduction histidine kinase